MLWKMKASSSPATVLLSFLFTCHANRKLFMEVLLLVEVSRCSLVRAAFRSGKASTEKFMLLVTRTFLLKAPQKWNKIMEIQERWDPTKTLVVFFLKATVNPQIFLSQLNLHTFFLHIFSVTRSNEIEHSLQRSSVFNSLCCLPPLSLHFPSIVFFTF